MPPHKRARSLVEISVDCVCDQMVTMVIRGGFEEVEEQEEEEVEEVAEFEEVEEVVQTLSALGLLDGVVDTILDRLSLRNAKERVWRGASRGLLGATTRCLRIKPGWEHGQVLVSRVRQLLHLTHVEVTGAGSDPLLTGLSLGCPALLSLHASYSAEVSDLGLRALAGMCSNPSAGDENETNSSTALAGSTGCTNLTNLQVISCPQVSTAAVVNLLLQLPSISYIAFERLDRVFRSEALFKANRIYQMTNYEHHHSHLALERGESPPLLEDHRGYFTSLAKACPRLRTAKLGLSTESDGYIRHLTSLTSLEEVILDFPGPLGHGFHHFFTLSGARLVQLGLTVREVSAWDVATLSLHCPNLRVLHLFLLTFQAESSQPLPTQPLFPRLEGLYLGMQKNSAHSLVHNLLVDRLLTSCVNLRTLYLSGSSPRLDSSYLEYKLQQGALASLENCHIGEEARLGKAAYAALLKHCPNLRKLNVSSWDISRAEFLEMKAGAARLNHDLVLLGGKA